MEVMNWKCYLWEMHIPKSTGVLFAFPASCPPNCSFPIDMNYSRFITTVSAARQASPIRLLSEYTPVLHRLSGRVSFYFLDFAGVLWLKTTKGSKENCAVSCQARPVNSFDSSSRDVKQV